MILFPMIDHTLMQLHKCGKRNNAVKKSIVKDKSAIELLSPSEKKHLKLYEQKWFAKYKVRASDSPNCVFLLSDNPQKRCTWTRCGGKLPCFKKSGGKLWIPNKGRWMTAHEKLCSLGYPVNEMMAKAAGCQLLEVESPHLHAMAGNAWHICNAGMVMVAALACVETTSSWGGDGSSGLHN